MTMTQYSRHEVYEACRMLDMHLRSKHGLRLALPYGNACDRTNRGEYKFELYQTIASQVLSGNFDVTTYPVDVPTSAKECDGRPLNPNLLV